MCYLLAVDWIEMVQLEDELATVLREQLEEDVSAEMKAK